jgi:hypothetical protein
MVMSSGTRGDLMGRTIGMLVFLLGVGLLIWVFAISYGLFTANPATALGMHITGDPKKDPGVTLIGTNFGWLLFRIAFLFIMSLSGSFIAQKGINLYFSAVAGHPVHATLRHTAPTPAPSASSTADAGH